MVTLGVNRIVCTHIAGYPGLPAKGEDAKYNEEHVQTDKAMDRTMKPVIIPPIDYGSS